MHLSMAACSSSSVGMGTSAASCTSVMPSFSRSSPFLPPCTTARAVAAGTHGLLPKPVEAAATPTSLAVASCTPKQSTAPPARWKLCVAPSPQPASKSLRLGLNHNRVSKWHQVHHHHHHQQVQPSGGKGKKKKLLLVQCAQVANSPSSSSSSPPSPAANAEAATQQQPQSSRLVLVVGATGGVGQLVVASLLEKGVSVRAIVRNGDKARTLFGDKLGDQFQFRVVDIRQAEGLHPSIFEGVTHVINATGTSAFPSKRWFGDNGTKNTDWFGFRNLVNALPKTVQRVVLVSSIGVTKPDQLPFSFLNLFGVLKYKKLGEDHLRNSGIPFTILRPGRLIDGPYTSYDLNTLLKATTGTRRDVILGQGDVLAGDASRLVVAEAAVQVLDLKSTEGQIYELNSAEGDGPGKDPEKWASLFQAV